MGYVQVKFHVKLATRFPVTVGTSVMLTADCDITQSVDKEINRRTALLQSD